MARIRTIKPSFWDSPGIETLEPMWRLLYIAMWNWADGEGRGKAEARELLGFAFPRDEELTVGEFRRGLGEVRRVFGVYFYRVDGRAFYAIPSWHEHQKIDSRYGPQWPDPIDGEPFDPVTNEQVEEVWPGAAVRTESPTVSPPRPRGDHGAGSRKEEVGNTKSLSPASDTPEFAQFWSVYPSKKGKGQARTAFVRALTKASLEEILDGAGRYREDPKRKPDYTKNPATWLNGECWSDESAAPAVERRRYQEV